MSDIVADLAVPKDAHHGDAAMETTSSDASSVSDVVGEVTASPRNPAPAASAAPKAPDTSVMELHEDETQPPPPTQPLATAASTAQLETPNSGICCQCGQPMGSTKGATTRDGPLHPQCIAEYKFLHQPRCSYCNIRFHDDEMQTFVKDPVTGALYHPDCRARAEAGTPYVLPTKEGEVRKFAIARSRLSRHNWKSRYFVLSPANGGIRYYANQASATNGGGGGGSKKGGDAESDGSASYDADADPDREAHEAKRAKGFVPLNRRSRLLTRPDMSNYKPSSSAASAIDIGIIFFESPESKKELRLVFKCDSVEERSAWIKALEAYIDTVDDPADYTNARAAVREKEKAKEAKEAKEEAKEEKEKEKEEKKEKAKK